MGTALWEFVRMIVVLAVVVGLVVALGRVTQRWQRGRGASTPGGRIDVLARRAVGKNAALLVVRVAHRTFLVSQGAQQLRLLSELDDQDWSDTSMSTSVRRESPRSTSEPRMARGSGILSPTAWDAFIEHLRERTVRR